MNNVGTCPFEFNKLPPCIIMRTYKWGYLKDFLYGKSGMGVDLIIAHDIECIEFKKDWITIRNSNCINCMFCVFGCPGNYIEIRSNYELFAMCSNFKIDYKDKLSSNILDSYFKGSFLNMPSLGFSHFKIKYTSFSSFTERNETQNISVWGANAIKFLSSSENPKIGLEINMNIATRDRGGRLDICSLSDDYLIVAEAKVNFRKMMDEGRYLSQMQAYEEEIVGTLKEFKDHRKYYKFLLIGGDERDLLPPNHPLCTSREGNQADLFYNVLISHNIFFISASALLAMGILKVFNRRGFEIEYILDKIQATNGLGLLSCGLVTRKENGTFEINNIN